MRIRQAGRPGKRRYAKLVKRYDSSSRRARDERKAPASARFVVGIAVVAVFLFQLAGGAVAEEADAAYWINVLRESPSEACSVARAALIAMGTEALPALIAACGDENDWVRWEAVNALGSIAHQEPEATIVAIPAISSVALTDDNSHPRWRSLYALACFPQETIDVSIIPLLLGGLKDPAPEHQWRAAVALAYFGQQVAVPMLNEGVEREESYEKWEAIYCLGFVHDETSIARLIEVMLDLEQEARIRQESALVLGRIGALTAGPALVKALSDPEDGVRWRAASSLARLGNASALPDLQIAYEAETDEFAKEQISRAIEILVATPSS